MECILKDIIKIQKAIREKSLVIFVGAGVSANSGVPTWGTLIDKIAKELKIEKDIQQNEYLKIAQYYYNNNPKTFFASIKNFLDVERQLKSINEYLFKEFKPKYFVTTNYDDTLEKINSISYHITHINYISISGTQSGLQIFPRLTGPLSNSICFIILLSCGLTVYFICKFLFLISLNLHISGQSPL